MNIEQRVVDVVASQLRRPPVAVLLTSSLAEDLGADSLDTTELVIALELEFDVDLGKSHQGVRTVRDVVTLVERAISAGVRAAAEE